VIKLQIFYLLFFFFGKSYLTSVIGAEEYSKQLKIVLILWVMLLASEQHRTNQHQEKAHHELVIDQHFN
jgi:hypothetical protein